MTPTQVAAAAAAGGGGGNKSGRFLVILHLASRGVLIYTSHQRSTPSNAVDCRHLTNTQGPTTATPCNQMFILECVFSRYFRPFPSFHSPPPFPSTLFPRLKMAPQIYIRQKCFCGRARVPWCYFRICMKIVFVLGLGEPGPRGPLMRQEQVAFFTATF